MLLVCGRALFCWRKVGFGNVLRYEMRFAYQWNSFMFYRLLHWSATALGVEKRYLKANSLRRWFWGVSVLVLFVRPSWSDARQYLTTVSRLLFTYGLYSENEIKIKNSKLARLGISSRFVFVMINMYTENDWNKIICTGYSNFYVTEYTLIFFS